MTSSVRGQSTIWSVRGLIWNFAQRDLKSRFKGTALGWAWSLVVPISTLVIYTLVFAVIFRIDPPPLGNGSPGNFTLFLFAGLVVWTVFANGINTGILSLLTTGGLLKKVYFPSYAPVLGSVIAILAQSGIEVAVLLGIMVVLGNVSWTYVLLVPWAVLFIVFVSATIHTLAVLNVVFRDLSHIVNVIIQLLFYLTPVIYSLTFIPMEWRGIPLRRIIGLNPLTEFVTAFRNCLYDLTPPAATTWLGMLFWTVVALGGAFVVHRKLGQDVGERI